MYILYTIIYVLYLYITQLVITLVLCNGVQFDTKNKCTPKNVLHIGYISWVYILNIISYNVVFFVAVIDVVRKHLCETNLI